MKKQLIDKNNRLCLIIRLRKTQQFFDDKARIDKAVNERTAYKIQLYNDYQIDELVKKVNEGEVNSKPTKSQLWADLAVLNKPEVYKNYNKIINSKYTSNDNLDNLIIKNLANKDLNRIVEAELERISKNIDYAEQVLNKYEVPLNMYEEFKKEQSKNSIQSRQQLLKDVAIKANDLLVSEGLNIPSVYTYRNVETTAESLLRQSQMGSKHQEILAINDNYINQGKNEIYTGKEWIWTHGGETTRHRSNHLQKRQLKEPFIIVNDKTLHIDELMYPSDPAGSFSNSFICYCECQYLTGDKRDYEYIGSLSLNGGKFNVNSPALKPKTTFMNAKKFKEQFNQPKPVNVSQPAGINIQEHMNVNVGTPILSLIDDTIDGVTSVPHNYLIDGNKVEVIYDANTGKYYYNGLELKEYDLKTKMGKVSKSAVTKHNNNILKNNAPKTINNKPKVLEPQNPTGVEVVNKRPVKEHIDTSELTYIDEFKSYIITELDGIQKYGDDYYYKGMKVDYQFGEASLTKTQIMLHNEQVRTNNQSNIDIVKVTEKPKPEIVDIHKLVYEDDIDAYIVTKFDGIVEYDGEYYYKGFKLDYYDVVSKSGYIDREEVLEYNNKIKSNTEEPIDNIDSILDKIKLERQNHLSDEQASKMHILEVAGHYNIEILGKQIDTVDNKYYYVFRQIIEDSNGYFNQFRIYFEVDTLNTYDRVSPSQILNEVAKIPNSLKAETKSVWFKDSEDGIVDKQDNNNYKPLERNTKGINWKTTAVEPYLSIQDDYNCRIQINSNFFKKRDNLEQTWYDIQDTCNLNDFWKKTLNHEFTHSGDFSRSSWQDHKGISHSERDYKEIHNDEPYFTPYANTKVSEAMAEHGGYIAYMEANPSEQHRRIQINVKDEYGVWTVRRINYKEYKELYPKNYKYFIKKLYDEGF